MNIRSELGVSGKGPVLKALLKGKLTFVGTTILQRNEVDKARVGPETRKYMLRWKGKRRKNNRQ